MKERSRAYLERMIPKAMPGSAGRRAHMRWVGGKRKGRQEEKRSSRPSSSR